MSQNLLKRLAEPLFLLMKPIVFRRCRCLRSLLYLGGQWRRSRVSEGGGGGGRKGGYLKKLGWGAPKGSS